VPAFTKVSKGSGCRHTAGDSFSPFGDVPDLRTAELKMTFSSEGMGCLLSMFCKNGPFYSRKGLAAADKQLE